MSKDARPAELMEPVPELRAALTPMDMLSRAVEQGATIETLKELMILRKQWDADEARKAYENAITDAKAELPTITRNKVVSFETRSKEGKTSFRHETLDHIVEAIRPVLQKHGLQHGFRTDVHDGKIIVTCRITHRDGHYEEPCSLPGPADTSGAKNAIQAIGSTVTYLQRYTLKAALGLAVSDDDDGQAPGGPATITEEQARELEKRLLAVKADIAKFCEYIGATSIAAIPADRYESAYAAVRVKEKQSTAKKNREAADAVQ